MHYNAVLCVLNAKYVHASPAPYCLLAGVRGLQNTLNNKQKCCSAHVGEHQENTCFNSEDILLNVDVVDTTVQKAEKQAHIIAEEIKNKRPIIVGFSCYIWNIEQTLKLARIVKEICPQVKIVLGGPEVSYNAKHVLAKNMFVDYILSGEGEESFAQLFLYTARNKQAEKGEIKGLCTRQFESEPCVLGDYIKNRISDEYLKALDGRIAYIEASRGCPYSCAFCLSGRCGKPRYFDNRTVFDNILKLVNENAKTVKFVDRTFNANVAHANEILNFVLENYGKAIKNGVCFHFEIAADILRQSTLDILRKMPQGAVQLEIGMQSFNEKTLAAINRKTDTQKVRENIEELMQMGNIHIHIDLIAGLIYEDLSSFKNSFNMGYSLNAHVMQLGFLKILHGSTMSEKPDFYKCEYSKLPPYEVEETPWLSKQDLQTIKFCENELERIYNSGRFRRAASYAMKQTGQSAFDFYSTLGRIADERGVAPHGVSLDDYTEFLFKTLCEMPQIDVQLLRDEMVRDRLSTNAGGKLAKALHIKDDMLGKAVKALDKCESTKRQKSIKRAVAILYGAQNVCYVDYAQKNAITHDYILHEINIDNVLE